MACLHHFFGSEVYFGLFFSLFLLFLFRFILQFPVLVEHAVCCSKHAEFSASVQLIAYFLLFFIKLSDHCQRGTSQSTYLLAWETGIGGGLMASFGLFNCSPAPVLWTCLGILAATLILYVAFVHKWYIAHKNR